jgi:hypothetical protein
MIELWRGQLGRGGVGRWGRSGEKVDSLVDRSRTPDREQPTVKTGLFAGLQLRPFVNASARHTGPSPGKTAMRRPTATWRTQCVPGSRHHSEHRNRRHASARKPPSKSDVMAHERGRHLHTLGFWSVEGHQGRQRQGIGGKLIGYFMVTL